MKTLISCLAALALLSRPAVAVEKIRVSSFSTVLTEIAERIGGGRVEVTAHVKAGVDPHEFEPRPADLKTVADSQLVLLSAKHLEGYVSKLAEATNGRGNFLQVGDGFGGDDPHWWHSIANVAKATAIVRDALVKISPADADVFSANAAAYLAQLSALGKWVKLKLAELPRDRRKLVTSHDAFQYFAKENGFTIYPVEGVSSSDQPSSQHVAEIIRVVKEQHVKAIFPESIENPKVLAEITRETGAAVGGKLCADGLGEGGAATYEGMYTHTVSTIVDALK